MAVNSIIQGLKGNRHTTSVLNGKHDFVSLLTKLLKRNVCMLNLKLCYFFFCPVVIKLCSYFLLDPDSTSCDPT